MRCLPLMIFVSLFSFGTTGTTQADFIGDISGLSSDAVNSLVAHYDGRRNVATTGNVVDSWTPVDAFGNSLNGMNIVSTQRGNGAADLITYDGTGTLHFDDTAIAADGRYLSGTLTNSGGSNFTVFWRGHYEADAPFDTSGTYAYNIGLSDISHQRDNCGNGFCVEIFNGTTYVGDDITAFDGTDTTWSTVVTADSHTAYANGIDLNMQGTPTYDITSNADIVVGAFSGGGFDMVGDFQQLIIFETALSNSDRLLVEDYLNNVNVIPEPTSILPLAIVAWVACRRRSDRTNNLG